MPSIGRFEIQGELGRGGLGVVLRAVDPQLRREVAIKQLLVARADERLRRRFAREARLLARVRHPHVIRVHEVGEDERARPFIVMDLVRGGSLQDRIDRSGPIPPAEARAIAVKLARALAAAHAVGVLHRDLKPANVLVRESDGEPVLTDFGLARVHRLESASTEADSVASPITVEGAALGTPGFAAPEQMMGSAERVGPAADVYGLGATLYCLLTGRPPFVVMGLAQLIVAQLREPPPPPSRLVPGVEPALDAICLRCLAAEPPERFASIEALAEALEGEGTVSAPASIARARRRRRGALALVAASVLTGVAVAAWLGSGAVASRREAAEAARAARELAVEAFETRLALARDGRADALRTLRDGIDELERTGGAGGDAALAREVAVARGLAAVARGDEVLLRQLAESDRPPWDTERAALCAAVLSRRDPRALAVLIERDPRTLARADCMERVERAIAGWELAPAAADRLLRAVDAGAPPDEPVAARRRALLRARLVVAVHAPRLRALDPAGGREELEAIRPALEAIVRASRAFHGRVPLPDEALDRLAAIAGQTVSPTSHDPLGLTALEALIVSNPPEAMARVAPLAKLIWVATVSALWELTNQATRDPELNRSLFTLAAGLQQLGAWAYSVEMAAAQVSVDPRRALTESYFEERATQTLATPTAELVPADAGTLLGTLVGLQTLYDMNMPAGLLPAGAVPQLVRLQSPVEAARALLARRELVAKILERDRAHGDVPGFVLSWLATRVSELVRALPAEAEARGALAAMLGESPDRIEAAIGALHERAEARDAARPIRHRDLRVPINRAAWAYGTAGPRAAVEPMREAFALIARKREEQYAFDWHGQLGRPPPALLLVVEVARATGHALCREPDAPSLLAELAEGVRVARSESPASAELEALGVLSAGGAGADDRALSVLAAHLERAAAMRGRGDLLPGYDLMKGLGEVPEGETGRGALVWRASLWGVLGEPDRARADRAAAARRD